jgi:hypothetical protein
MSWGSEHPPAAKLAPRRRFVRRLLCSLGFHDWEFDGIHGLVDGAYLVCRDCRLRAYLSLP